MDAYIFSFYFPSIFKFDTILLAIIVVFYAFKRCFAMAIVHSTFSRAEQILV